MLLYYAFYVLGKIYFISFLCLLGLLVYFISSLIIKMEVGVHV